MIKILCADALEGLRTLPNDSVSMCVTSPPYYGLRDYGNAGQIGIEDSPEEGHDPLPDDRRQPLHDHPRLREN